MDPRGNPETDGRLAAKRVLRGEYRLQRVGLAWLIPSGVPRGNMSARATSIPPAPMTSARVREVVNGRQAQYSGADFSAAVVTTTVGPRLTRGVLRFVFSGEPLRDERLDYGSFVLVRKRVSLEQGLAIIEEFRRVQTPARWARFWCGSLSIDVPQSAPEQSSFGTVGQRAAGRVAQLRGMARPNQYLLDQEPSGPLIRQGLPTIANPHQYPTDWIALDRQRQAHEQNVVVVIVPDHRLRLGPVTFGEEEVTVAVDFGPETTPRPVSFRAAWILDQPYRESRVELGSPR